jgi:hypothetical protein
MNRIDPFKQRHHILFGLIRAIDVALNGVLHFDFGHTLSAWYGRHKPDCLLCRLFHRHAEPWHCVRAALSEGTISRERARDLTNGEVT